MSARDLNPLPIGWLLALETSGKTGSASIGKDGSIRASRNPTNQARSASSLAPSIQSLLSEACVDVSEISCIAVTNGPGSFTGLRVGIATAKTLAFALDIPAVGVDTLHAIAWQVRRSEEENPCLVAGQSAFRFWTAMDAFRGELFVAQWQLQSDLQLDLLSKSQIMTISEWLNLINAPSHEGLLGVVGPGLVRCNSMINKAVVRLPSEIGLPHSESVFALGWSHFVHGEATSADALLPNYFRQSAAEEKKHSRQ